MGAHIINVNSALQYPEGGDWVAAVSAHDILMSTTKNQGSIVNNLKTAHEIVYAE